jgi:hypothetical protein
MKAVAECATPGIVTFASCNAQNQRLFRLNPGICAIEALEHASLLMASVNELTLPDNNGEPQSNLVWAAHYLGDMAKAIIDDVTVGLQSAQYSGESASQQSDSSPSPGQ